MASRNDFEHPHVIEPTEVHKFTIVWFHDIGSNGYDSMRALRTLRNPNVKWIIPTAHKRHVTSMRGRSLTAWFDLSAIESESMQDDWESLYYINSYIALLLSSEPKDVVKGVGGIGMGASQVLFYAVSFAFGDIGMVPEAVQIVIALDGWLPCLGNFPTNMSSKPEVVLRAASQRILITHGTSPTKNTFVKKCADSLCSAGFQTTFKLCGGADPLNEMRDWLIEYYGIWVYV